MTTLSHLHFKSLKKRSLWMSLYAMLLLCLLSCKKDTIDRCIGLIPEDIVGNKLGNKYIPTKILAKINFPEKLCIVTNSKLIYISKTNPEDAIEEKVDISQIIMNDQDTIILVQHEWFYRLFPSEQRMELIYQITDGACFEFCVTPGHGIGYTSARNSTTTFNYFTFKDKSNSKIFTIEELIPELYLPFDNFQTFIREGKLKLFVSKNIPFGELMDKNIIYLIDLENASIEKRHILKDVGTMRVIDFNDFEQIAVHAILPYGSNYNQQLFYYNISNNTIHNNYSYKYLAAIDKGFITDEYVSFLSRNKKGQTSAVLVHWPTGKTVIEATVSEGDHYGSTYFHNTDYLIFYHSKIDHGIIFNKQGCPVYKTNTDKSILNILATESDCIIISNYYGIVEKFVLH